MFGLSSPLEIGIVAVVVVLLFGTRRLPELGAGLGKAISNFRHSYREGESGEKGESADNNKPSS